jgi:hypothetical protein
MFIGMGFLVFYRFEVDVFRATNSFCGGYFRLV